jgi:gamma-glutamyltranspeptidase / glutathione hydrolase
LRARVRDGKPVVGPTEQWTPPASEGHTTSFSIADKHGNMVCVTQSLGSVFGSGVVVPGTGISLQNRGATFVLQKGHPNQVGPKKRPFQTIIPGFVTKDGKPVMSFGVMGGTMQPQGHTQVMVRIADYDQNPQAACDGPRFRWVQGLDVSVEDRMSPQIVEGLKKLGHRIVTVDDYNQFGSCQAIWKLESGYLAASDPRRDGQAAGF